MILLKPYVPGTYRADGPPAPVRELAYFLDNAKGDNATPTLRCTYLFDQDEYNNLDMPSKFEVEVINLDTNETRTIITQTNISFFMEEIHNTKLRITTINNWGRSVITTEFILPAYDIIPLDIESDGYYTIKNKLDVINRGRDTFFEYPRWLMFYSGVSYTDIETERLTFATANTFKQSALVDEDIKYAKQDFYGEVPKAGVLVRDATWSTFGPDVDFGFSSQSYFMKLTSTGWVSMTQDEVSFITTFKESIQKEYQHYIARKGLTYESPVVLKFIIQHPEFLKDSIIIYLVEGQQWQL